MFLLPAAAVVVLLAIPMAAVFTLWRLRDLAEDLRDGGGRELKPVNANRIDDFIADPRTLALVTECEFAEPLDAVWHALLRDGMYHWSRWVRGIAYADQRRGLGVARMVDSRYFTAVEETVLFQPGRRISFSGVRISMPLLATAFVEDYQLERTAADGTLVRWTIASRRRVLPWFPLHWATRLVHPFTQRALDGLTLRIAPPTTLPPRSTAE